MSSGQLDPTAEHRQLPSTVSTASTVVETSPTGSRLAPCKAKIDGLPTSATAATYILGSDKRSAPQEHSGSRCPPVIPPTHSSRTLVVCFDGTGDQFDNDNSNIVHLVAMLKKDDRHQQLVYYQAGIGTYTSSPSAVMSRLKKTLDIMFAWNLNHHVMGGYEFLMQNYIAGDKISIFGFSRGAYTARSLAGMLHKVGLLPSGNFQQVPFAYKMYKRADDIGWEQSNEFKKVFSVDVSIDFIGVWDTVDSVGFIPKRLPFTTSNTIVRTFRHAVSLDERRAKFKANLWNRPTTEETKLGTKSTNVSLKREETFDDPSADHQHRDTKNGYPKRRSKSVDISGSNKAKKRVQEDEDDRELNALERLYSESSNIMTDIEEVWFAGSHCDVGGGSVSNKTRHSLARIALRWMVRECFKANTGIMFHSDKLREIGLEPSTLYPHVLPRPKPLTVQDHRIQNPPTNPIPIRTHKYLTKKHNPHVHQKLLQNEIPFLGTEEEEEVRDAVSPKYDQLKIQKAWWSLEIAPLPLRYQRADNQWVTRWGSNMGSSRYIPQQRTNGFKVHRSVKMRMEAEYEDEQRRQKGKRYVPKPLWKVEPTWID